MSSSEAAIPPVLPPELQLMQMVNGYWVSQAIYVAAKLGVADLLQAGAMSSQALAQATHTHPQSLYRLLRALASVGIFVETEPETFTLTPLATYLRSDVPGSLRAMAMMSGEEHYKAWGSLDYSIQTGNNAFEHLYGMPVFPYYAEHPEPAQIFDQAMTSYSSTEIAAVIDSYDFSPYQTIVDIAGGQGSLLAAILHKYNHLQGILFEQASVLATALPFITQQGLTQRCQLISGSFFETMPAGGDIYLFKHIIHDWGDDHALAILQQCHQAMPAHSKLLLIEQVIPPGNEPFIGKLLDLNMLVMCPGGCERTESEYRQLLANAGFAVTEIVPTPAFVSLVVAVKQAS